MSVRAVTVADGLIHRYLYECCCVNGPEQSAVSAHWEISAPTHAATAPKHIQTLGGLGSYIHLIHERILGSYFSGRADSLL